MTVMIDAATRVVPAAVLRPAGQAADAGVLLDRVLAPELVRPGWPGALKVTRSALPPAGRPPGSRAGRAAAPLQPGCN